MGLEFRRDRNGKLIRTWYCLFRHNGKKISRKLKTPMKGKPPSSELISDTGDKDFEASRAAALEAYEELKARYKRINETDEQVLAQEAFGIKRGAKYDNTKVGDLEEVYKQELNSGLKRSRKRTTAYLEWKGNTVGAFVKWWRESGRSPKKFTWEISTGDAREYIDFLSQPDESGKSLKTDTISRIKTILSDALALTLPMQTSNPFSGITVGRQKGETVVHREPLTQEEVGQLLETAQKNDPLVYELIMTGISTALRRGDVCRLKWKSVNLDAPNGNSKLVGTVRVELGKTGRTVELPIFAQFRLILEKRLASRTDNNPYVFPEAAELIEKHPDNLTYRVKKVFAQAFAYKGDAKIQAVLTIPRSALKDNLEKVINAVKQAPMPEERREKTIMLLKHYAQGKSFNAIVRETKTPKSTVSLLLRDAATASGIAFTPKRQPKDAEDKIRMREAIASITRCKRKLGKRDGSIYDFHALRTTFVTLAAINGIPLETITLITGHTNTRMIQEHYDRARGSDFADKFNAALPASVTMLKVAGNLLEDKSDGKVTPTTMPRHVSKHDMAVLKAGLAQCLTEAQKKELVRSLLT